ncbi:hypothetical protein MMC06_006418 [Schaereria dolodes]|nr:hypothetical protein [Schaereria dolodes]
MSEDQALLARIRQVAGQINLHKVQTPAKTPDYSDTLQTKFPLSHGVARISASGRPIRGSSYSYRGARGRAGKISNPYRNRSLVLKNAASHNLEDPEIPRSGGNISVHNPDGSSGPAPSSSVATSWITKRDRHMQLINSSIFDKETELRTKAIEETRRQKVERKGQREKRKITRHSQLLRAAQDQSTTQKPTPLFDRIVVNDVQFQVRNGGSKLSRLSGPSDTAHSTPQTANIGGVLFLRSKNGNLYRSGLIKAKRAGQIKKHATTMVEKPARFGQEEDSDLSSAEEDYEELNTDDVDSDAFEDDMIDPSKGVENHAIAQQRDFVQF